MPLKAADDLLARRMHLPARPALLEAEQADDAALFEVIRVALFVAVVPFHACELRLGDRLGAQAEVDWKVVERLALHSSGIPIGAQAARSHSRSAPESVGPIFASTWA